MDCEGARVEPLTASDLDEGEYFYKSRSPLVEGRGVRPARSSTSWLRPGQMSPWC